MNRVAGSASKQAWGLARPSVRLLVMLGAFMFALVGISARLVWMQVLAAPKFEALAADQRERRVVLPPQRGSILDRDGADLAMSLEMRAVTANPRFIPDPAAAAQAISPILNIPTNVLEAKLSRKSGFVYLERKVEPETAEKVKALGIPGVYLEPEAKRFYPAGQLAAQVVGFVGAENQGLGGLEGRYEKLLRGTPGEMLMESDPQGRSIPAGKSRMTPPEAGHDLVLTIDREIQFFVEAQLAEAVKAYKARSGTAIVLDPVTGKILAMATVPTFDPNDFKASKPEQRKNHALVDVYEPGSANKVITAAAALELGVIRSSDRMKVADTYRIANKTFKDAHPHGVLNLSFAEVIQQSSNVGTIKVAGSIGKERLYDYLSKFGYGQMTGLDWPGETPGLLPKPSKWWATSLGTIAIGQGVAVTPMQIVSVFGTVANDGVAVQPKLIDRIVDPYGRSRQTPDPVARRVIKAETAEAVTRILVGVTEGEHGTGSAAAIPGYQVAGKTGTAQKPKPGGGYEGYIGSFIGYAPAGEPRLVVGVMLDDPTPIWGGVTAAPVFKQIMNFGLRHLGIGPGPVLQQEGTPLPAPGRSPGASTATVVDPAKGAPVTDGTAD